VVFTYLDAFSTPEHFAKFLPEYENLDAMKDHYRRGGLGDGTCKKFLFNIMEDFLQPMRERRKQYEQNIPQVYEILRKGSEAARAEAAKTLADVRKAMKIDYFDDAELIAEHTKKYQG
jgi:tryptophanyl-tRNA synthetase